MLRRLLIFCLFLALAAPAGILPAAARGGDVSGCHSNAATAPKQKDRKPAGQQEKKRPASSSLGQGCIGCIAPFDGLSATMAVRLPLTDRPSGFEPAARSGLRSLPDVPPPRKI
jgi:hypothetical protein